MSANILSDGRNATKARVQVIDWDGSPAVEKDYSDRPLLVRRLFGPLMLNREERALRELSDADGFPRLLARPGRTRLVMSKVAGTPLRRMLDEKMPLPDRFFERLDALIFSMHRKGVAQGDIGLGDVLVGDDGAPAILDFSVSVVRHRGLFARLLFGFAAAQDNRRFERLRHRFKPVAGAAAPQTGRSRVLARLRLLGLYALILFWGWTGVPTTLEFLAALPLVLAGSLVRIWSAGHLLKTRDLAVCGPYGHCQHPLYLGRLLLFSGFAIMAGLPYGANLVILAGGLAIFFGFYLPRKLRVEGARLEEEHGEAYIAYRNAVPILLPSLRPWRGGASGARWQLARFLRNREVLMVLLETGLLALFAWRAFG
ncbi:MAG: hypothetical protein ACE5IK_08695 [Acidobacteriota bacterium]